MIKLSGIAVLPEVLLKLEVVLARHAGFCSGVRKAVVTVLAASKEGTEVYTLGPLVHNEMVGQYLAEHGVYSVSSVEEATGPVLVIRTHGVAPAVLEKARSRGLKVIDCTCPRVRRVQELAAEAAATGARVVIFGDPSHPEVAGIAGWAGDGTAVVSSAGELDKLELQEPTVLLVQTTASKEDFAAIKALFLEKVPGGKVFDTLCPETGLKQDEAIAIAESVDTMVVVGSATSANTGTMVEICRRLKPTYRVAGAGDLKPHFFTGCRRVGVTAGASTPDWTIKEVVERMEKGDFVAEDLQEVEKEPEIENEQEKDEVKKEAEEVEFAFEDALKVPQAGEQVAGTVVRAAEDEVFVDVGYKTEALLPKNEVYLSEGESLADKFTPGEEIEVTVLSVDDQDGKIVVSHKRLAKEKRWAELEQACAEGTTLEGKVKQVVPKGMVFDLGAGLEGFMPGSMVDLRYIPDFKGFLGTTVAFKVTECNREKDKIILSRKKVLEEEIARRKEEIFRTLEPGSVIKGIVRRLTNFGAFVDVGGIDGLIHISELSWERVAHPQEVLKVGDEIDVKVLEVIPEKERISLSLRAVQPDPWTRAVEEFKSGEIVKGKVTRLAAFGAFIELRPGVEGLAHISQLADFHVKHPSEVLKEGEEVSVKILEIKPVAKRISLSVKEARGVTPAAPAAAERNSASDGNVTLGDLFGDLFDEGKAGAADEGKDAAEEAGAAGDTSEANEASESDAGEEQE